jgi:hypothetical protein
VPRFIDETVMRQLETDQALARLRDETTITAVIVLIEIGLRSNDALQLPADPVVVLPDGSPVLRFRRSDRRARPRAGRRAGTPSELKSRVGSERIAVGLEQLDHLNVATAALEPFADGPVTTDGGLADVITPGKPETRLVDLVRALDTAGVQNLPRECARHFTAHAATRRLP